MFDSNSLCEILTGGESEIIKWCQTVGLIRRERICDICSGNARIYLRKTGNSRWRCVKRGADPHDWGESITKNTIFEGTKFGIGRILHLFYFFAHGITRYADIIRETSTSAETTSETTVNQWLTFCRKVCSKWLDGKIDSQDGKIGGPGLVVEIGETAICKRKRGGGSAQRRRASLTEDQQWIVGMVEIRADADLEEDDDGEEDRSKDGRFRVELCANNVRDRSTLLDLIRKHVRHGSTVMTDCWQSTYGCLESYDCTPVNQRQWRAIENQFRLLKKEVCRGGINEDNLSDHFCEFVWRREMDYLEKDRYLGFIECAVEVYSLY